MVTFHYGEGDWFAGPLRDNGFAAGVVARANPNGVLLGYFFGPKRDEVPAPRALEGLTASGAVLVGKFGDLGIRSGRWPLIGRIGEWNRRAWVMPAFGRIEELSGRAFKVFYDDDNPNKFLRELQVTMNDVERLPRDGLLGAGAVELLMDKLCAERRLT